MQLRDNYKYTYITTATTTQVLTGQGTLVRIIVNTTAAGTIGIIDGIAGTTVNVGQMKASIPENSYEYGIQVVSGVRIVTGAASDITVVTSALPS